MIAVIVDTNALLLPFQERMNLDAELGRLLGSYEIIVPEPIVGELERLTKNDRNASSALRLARLGKIVKAEKSGDDSVLELALKLKGIVLTNDKTLISRARSLGLRVIRQRGRAHLAFDGGVEPK